jgi:hypothetical protein
MLIIGFIIAFCLYVGLYWIYLATQSQLLGPLAMINKALFMPEPSVFFLLRGLILITLFYLVADALLSPARRGLKKRRQQRLDAERDKLAFRGSKAPTPPSEDDEDSREHSKIVPPRFSS